MQLLVGRLPSRLYWILACRGLDLGLKVGVSLFGSFVVVVRCYRYATRANLASLINLVSI